MPRFRAASRTASSTPTAKFRGVDDAFPRVMLPSPLTATQSVKVPPMSTPTM